MIVPKSNQKTYGVVHTKNYFSFEGFCKKIDSDEIQEVDVLLDEELIDTITANKENKKVEDIYDLKGFAFTYDLPSEFIGGENQISFKNHKTQENLNNSPCILLNKNDSKFNEASFMHSLHLPINKEIVKNIYCPNSVGFLGIQENLTDKKFIDFIYLVSKELPNIKINCFSFNNDFPIEIFNSNIDINYIKISNIMDIIQNSEIYIQQNRTTITSAFPLNKVINFININCVEIHCINLTDRYFLPLNQYDLLYKNHKIFTTYKEFGYSEMEIIKAKKSITQLTLSRFINFDDFNFNTSMVYILIKMINCFIKSKKFKEFINKWKLFNKE